MSQLVKSIFNNKFKIFYYFGFSLIELMVVMIIIGILASVVINSYPGYIAKTQITTALSTLQGYRKKVEVFYLDNTNNNGFASLININQIDPNIQNGNNNFNNSETISNINLTNNNGTIKLTATFSNNASSEIRGKSINLNITVDSNNFFSNYCNSDNIGNALLPKDCQQ